MLQTSAFGTEKRPSLEATIQGDGGERVALALMLGNLPHRDFIQGLVFGSRCDIRN
jgi:hypothetical protein